MPSKKKRKRLHTESDTWYAGLKLCIPNAIKQQTPDFPSIRDLSEDMANLYNSWEDPSGFKYELHEMSVRQILEGIRATARL